MVTLDRGSQSGRQPPAAGKDAADQRVVDAELAALAVQTRLRRMGVAMHLARVARVGVYEHELADVVQKRGDEQLVAIAEVDLARDALGGALGGDGVEAKALGGGVPARDP